MICFPAEVEAEASPEPGCRVTGSRKAGATGQERGEREGHRGATVEEIATRAQEEEEEPEKSKRRRGATEGRLVEILM